MCTFIYMPLPNNRLSNASQRFQLCFQLLFYTIRLTIKDYESCTTQQHNGFPLLCITISEHYFIFIIIIISSFIYYGFFRMTK